MLIIKIEDIDDVKVNLSSSAMINQDYELWCYGSNFADKYPINYLCYQTSLSKIFDALHI